MTREQQRQLKVLDMELLRLCLSLEGVISQRARLDAAGTQTYIDEFYRVLTKSIEAARREPPHENK